MKSVELIITSNTILSVDKNNTILKNHALVIKNDNIIDILPNNKINQYQSNNILHKDFLTPGFINTHTHAAMNLFKGLACDKPLDTWLKDHIWVAESQFISRDFIKTSTKSAIAEMIKSGTTYFNDMYFFADTTAKVCIETGIRLGLGLIFLDFPTVWADNLDAYKNKAINLFDIYKFHPLITPILAPHAPYTVSDITFETVLELSETQQSLMHIHIHETQKEIDKAVNLFGVRPLERLNKLGVLSDKLIAVHMTHLTESEQQLIKDTKTNVVHCPKSNLKLASGIADIKTLDNLGINIALGTDGSASNNNLDLLSEMQFASLLAKGSSLDATAINAQTILRMATINGAKAVGLSDKIGSLEIGKQADIVAFDTADVACLPHYDPVSQLVYSMSKQQITDVWIAGKAVLKDNELTKIDEAGLLKEVRIWQDKIASNLQ